MISPDPFLRPSALPLLDACPGAALMQAAYVAAFGDQEVISPEAETGTDLHVYADHAVEAWRCGAEWAAVIEIAAVHAAKAGIGRWDCIVLRRHLEAVRDLLEKHRIERHHVQTEMHLDMASLGCARGGTADLVAVVPGVLCLVVDLKAGYLDQGEAADHEQTRAYAFAAAEYFRCDRVEVYLSQPREAEDQRLSGAVYDANALRAAGAWVRQTFTAAKDPSAPLRPSYHCTHCRALTRCAAARTWIMDAQQAISLIGDPADPEGWADLCAATKVAAALEKQGKELCKAHIGAGNEVPGWKLNAGRTMTSIDNNHALSMAADDPERLRELAKHSTIKASAAKELEWIQPAVRTSQSAPSLAPDKRKETRG